MLHRVFSVPLGLSPSGALLKQNPFVVGSAISAGAGLVGGLMSGLFGSSNSQDAIDAQIAMNRENNYFNAGEALKARNWQSKENQVARDYATAQYEKELDWQRYLLGYNTPSEQMKRYREAGVNPYFALPNVQSGVLQSSPASPTPTSNGSTPATAGGAPSLHAYDPSQAVNTAVQGVSSAVNSYFQNANLAEKTRSEAIQNITRLDEQYQRLEKLRSDKNLSDSERTKYDEEAETIRKERELQLENLRRSNTLLRDNAENVRQDTRTKELQADGQALNNQYQDWYNALQRKLEPQQIRKMTAEIAKIFSESSYYSTAAALNTGLKAYYESMKILNDDYHVGQDISNQIAQSTKNMMINTAFYNMKMAKYGYNTRYVGTATEILGAAASFVPMAAGAKYLFGFGNKSRPIGFQHIYGK